MFDGMDNIKLYTVFFFLLFPTRNTPHTHTHTHRTLLFFEVRVAVCTGQPPPRSENPVGITECSSHGPLGLRSQFSRPQTVGWATERVVVFAIRVTTMSCGTSAVLRAAVTPNEHRNSYAISTSVF